MFVDDNRGLRRGRDTDKTNEILVFFVIPKISVRRAPIRTIHFFRTLDISAGRVSGVAPPPSSSFQR